MNLLILTDSLNTFLKMGGYAPYVWSAYGLVIITLCVNYLLTQRYFKRVVKQAQSYQDR